MLSLPSLIRATSRLTKPRPTQPFAPRATTPSHFYTTTALLNYSTPMAAPTDSQAAAEANTSGITSSSLTQTLKSKLDTTHVEIEDMSGGCGQAFNAIIVSSAFDKKTLLARHRLVNSALKEEIAAIHAWTPKCYTPEQWEKEREKMR